MSTIPDTATTVVRASHVPGPRQGCWTYADYARLPEEAGFRYEVIDGVLFMAPAPATRSVEVLALAGPAYDTLGVFSGEQALISRVLPGPMPATSRLFPREG